jgi:hypothetical protein
VFRVLNRFSTIEFVLLCCGTALPKVKVVRKRSKIEVRQAMQSKWASAPVRSEIEVSRTEGKNTLGEEALKISLFQLREKLILV